MADTLRVKVKLDVSGVSVFLHTEPKDGDWYTEYIFVILSAQLFFVCCAQKLRSAFCVCTVVPGESNWLDEILDKNITLHMRDAPHHLLDLEAFEMRQNCKKHALLRARAR